MKIAILMSSDPGSPSEIAGFTALWLYYLPRALEKAGVDIVKVLIPSNSKPDELVNFYKQVPIGEVDAILAMGLRYFTTVPKECYQALKERYPNLPICQIYDGSLLDSSGCDINFTMRNDDHRYPIGGEANRYRRHKRNNYYVGWAADQDLIINNQPEDQLNIFVDHPCFGVAQSDRTLEILLNLRELSRKISKISKYRNVCVRQLLSGKVEELDLSKKLSVELYDRKGIPFDELAKVYSTSHIFMVTHSESVGQSIIEAATAGSLVLSPIGCVNQDRLDTVRSIVVDTKLIQWEAILEFVDPLSNRNFAVSNNNWNLIASRIIKGVLQWDQNSGIRYN